MFTLGYIIQAMTAKKPKFPSERVRLAIFLLKDARFKPGDEDLKTAKHLIETWMKDTGAKQQLQEIIDQSKVSKE